MDILRDKVVSRDIVEKKPASVSKLIDGASDFFTHPVKEFNYDNVHFFEYGDKQMILILKDQEKIYFKGCILVECLLGSVDIHGFTLFPDGKGPYSVISGYGQSAFCFSSRGHVDTSELENELFRRKIRGTLKKNILKIGSNSSMLLLSRSYELADFSFILPEKWISPPHISGNNGKFILFHKAEEWLSCTFDIYSGNRIPHKTKYHPILVKLSGDILKLQEPRILICGGKGVGKSTTLQFLVNRMFQKWKAILIIDFDIGQPEFTIPGCVSIVLIHCPLLGPSFTHLWKPLRSIALGFVNPDLCMTKYFFAIDEFNKLCQEAKELNKIPWFINTMGYIKGFGMSFTTRIISSFKPSHLVQINSSTEPNLNVFPLTFENVIKIMERNPQNHELPPYYELVSFPAPNSKNMLSVPPRLAREIRVFSYMMFYGTQLFLKKVVLDKSPGEIGLFKANKIIAVCVPWRGSDHSECVGFGVILEKHDDVIHFLTPLSEEHLNSSFDVSVMELGLQNVSWENLNLFNKHILQEKNIKLGHKSMFSSSFLF